MNWDQPQNRYTTKTDTTFSENTLRLVFRDCLRGLHYCNHQYV